MENYMQRYQEYYAENFVLDADFQRWVRYGEANHNDFWNRFLSENPGKKTEIETAQTLLQGVFMSGEAPISEDEIKEVIAGLIGRIREEKQRQAYEAEEIEAGPRVRPLYWWLSAASILVLCAVGVWYTLTTSRKAPLLANTESQSLVRKVNDGNADLAIKLEDGSTVTLAPGASVQFPESFAGNVRQVQLSGKALFQVAKNPERPFIVYASELVTRVLGTTFSVNSPSGNKSASVEVIEGKVSVYRRQDFSLTANGITGISKGIVLTANQKVVYQEDDGLLTRALVEAPKLVQTGKSMPAFVYRNTPVADVLNDIEQAYQVDIIFDAEQLTDCPVTASLSNQPLLEKIAMICEAVEARFEVLDGQIIIYGKKCQN